MWAARLESGQKKTLPEQGLRDGAAFVVACTFPGSLLELDFFVVNVLADDRIKFLDQHLFGHVAFVLGGRVEVTGTGGGFELDFLANAFCCHDELLS